MKTPMSAKFLQFLLLPLFVFVLNVGWGQQFWKTTGSGTWTGANWGTSGAGPFTTAWTSGSSARFTANSTVTFASTTVGNVTVDPGVTVTVTTAGTLTTTAARTFDIGTGSTLTWTSQSWSGSASSAGFIKNGAGTWNIGAQGNALNATNFGFTLNAGTVILSGSNSFGGANCVLSINGGTIQTSGSRAFANSTVNIGGNFIFTGSGNDTYSGAVGLGAASRTITNSITSGSRIFSGVISGTSGSGLTFDGASTAQIYIGNASNTFTGTVTISGAEVGFANNGAFGNANNTIVINGGRLSAATTAGAAASYTLASTHGIQVGSTAGTSISPVSGGTLTFDGIITDLSGNTGILTKQGSGILSLGGVNTYTGATSINNGTIRLTTGNDRLPTTTVLSLGQSASANLGTLDLNGTNQTVAGLNSTIGSASAMTNVGLNNTITSTAAATLTVSGSGTYGAATDANSGIIAGAISLVKSGTGTLTLGDVNTYTGTTTINGGTLTLSGAGSIASSSAITVGSGGTFDVSGLTTALSLGATQSLKSSATGSNTTATISVALNKGITLSAGGLAFTSYGGGATAPLTVTGASAGSLALASAPITITTTTALAAGTYKLIAIGGSVTAAVSGTIGTLTMGGSGLASNTTGVLSIVNGELILTVTVNQYTVTFNGNSNTGGTMSNQTASSATNLTSNSFIRTGYTFGGWATSSGSATVAYADGGSYPFTSSTTLYAIWTANNLTVTYDSQGGSVISNGSTTTGGTVSNPGNPTKSGNTFNGWFLASSGGSAISFPYTHGQTEGFTLYAQWTIVTTPTINPIIFTSTLTSTYGTVSTGVSFIADGSSLTGNITVTAQSGYEVSTDNSSYMSSVSVSSGTTVYVRFTATLAAGTYNTAAAVVLTASGASDANVTTSSSGNTVSTKALTISGISISNKIYDGNTTATITGTAAYSGLVNGQSFSVTGTTSAVFSDKNVGTNKTITVTGYTAPSSNYSISQPSSLLANITTATLSVTSGAVTSKIYDGTTAATITGTLSEIISPDVVTLVGSGTFASANVGTGISVTSTSTLGGADAANYNLTQPTGLSGDITGVSQTITFASLTPATLSTADYSPGATASSGLSVTYTSSNSCVATIVAGNIHIVGAGATTITASQSGGGNYTAATSVDQTLVVQSSFNPTSTLTAGDVALLAINSANPDKFSMVFLKDVAANVAINFTDNGFTATTTTRTGEGFLTYTVPSGGHAAGTVITWNNGMTITGTGWSSAAPNNMAFNGSGDQLFVFSGNTANWSTLSGITLLYGLNYGIALSGTSNASNTVQPSTALLPATSWLNLGTSSYANTYFANATTSTSSVTVSGLASTLLSYFVDGANKWYANSTAAATFPSYLINTVSPSPLITTSGTLSAVSTTYGTASTSPTNFSVSASNLTADLTLTAPSGFQISSGSSYASSLTISPDACGAIAATSIDVRLAATTAVGTYSGNIVLSSTGATSVNVATVSSTVSAKSLAIIDLTATDKTYDGLTTVTVSGTPAYSGLVNSESFSVSGTVSWAFPNATVENNKTLTRTGNYAAPSANYTVTQPTLSASITTRSLTITANDVNKAFGATLAGSSGSTAFVSSGLQNGETIGSVTIVYGNGAASTDAVGTYTGEVTPSAATGGTFTAANYSISYVAGNIIVSSVPTLNPVTLTSALSTTYGTASTGVSFVASGSNLSTNITVTAQSGYQVSDDNTSFGSSVSVSSGTTVYVRFEATQAAGTYNNATAVILSYAGSTDVNISTSSSGNSVSAKALTISGISISNKVYDGNATATISGTAAYLGLVNGESFAVSGTPSATFSDENVGNNKTITVIDYTSPSSNYSFSQPSGLLANITTATLTLTSAAVSSKVYDGTTVATITGTLSGIISPDAVTLVGTGTFTSANVGTDLSVTSIATLSGAGAGNYALTQPTGLSGNITQATQTITFNSFNTPISASTTIVASSNFGSAISYSSSNSNVATIHSSTGVVAIVGIGTTTITASNAGNSNYSAASVSQVLTVNAVNGDIVTFPITWSGTPATVNAASQNLNLGAVVVASRGAGLTGSSSTSRFSASGWSTSLTLIPDGNTKYLTFTLTAASGFEINLNSAVINFALGSSGTGPTKYAFYSSVNGFASTSAQIGADLSASSTSITLPSSGYNNLSSIEIRIYGWGASASTGTGGFSSMSVTSGNVSCKIPSQSSSITGSSTVCSGTSQTYSVTTVAGVGYNWSLPNGWSGTSTTNSISSAAGSTGTISVTPYNAASGCTNYTATSQSVSVTANPAPTAPTAGNASRCGTGTVSISATAGAGETIDWYSAATGGTLLLSGNSSYTTPSISSTAIYYAEARNTTTGCVSATRTAVTTTVNTLPSAPTASSTSRCGEGAVTITASANAGETTDWFAASSGGSALAQSTGTFTTPTLISTTTYYAEARNTTTGCVSSTRTEVTATINALPTVVSLSAPAYCSNTTGTISTSASQTNVTYDLWTSGEVIPNTSTSGTGNQLSWTLLSAGDYFVVATNANNCTASSETITLASFNQYSYYPDTDGDGFGTGTLLLSCSATTPSGYSTSNTDCNDNNASISPGAAEICGDGIDNNCDNNENYPSQYRSAVTTGDWSDASTWEKYCNDGGAWSAAQIAPYNQYFNVSNPFAVTIQSGHTVTVSTTSTTAFAKAGSLSVAGNLIVNGNLTVTSSVINSGNVTINHGASFVQSSENTTNTGSGNFIVNMNLTGTNNGTAPNGRYWYLGSPMNNTVASLFFDQPKMVRLWSYNPSNNSWVTVINSSTTASGATNSSLLATGMGYLYRAGSEKTITFTGDASSFNNNITTPLSFTGPGYKYVSNPYTSHVDWRLVTRTGLNVSYWIRNAANNAYEAYNATSGVSTPSGTQTTRFIPPMQGFWIYAFTASSSLRIDNGDRTHSTNVLHAPMHNQVVRLNLNDGKTTDQAVVYENENASNGIEEYDTDKFMDENHHQVYFLEGTKQLTLDGLKDATAKQKVDMGIQITSAGTYTINAVELGVEEDVMLEDKFTHTFQDMKLNNRYSFTSNAGNFNNRFVLHFTLTPAAETAMETVEVGETVGELEGVNIYTTTGQQVKVWVTNTTDFLNATVKVYDAIGNLIERKNMTSNELLLDLDTATGVYLVEVTGDSKVFTKKIFISK